MKFELTNTETSIIDLLNGAGQTWIVGGAVRDMLLGKTPKDIDLATDLVPDTVESLITSAGFICIPDKKAKEHGIIRAVDRDTGDLIDIATLRRDVSTDGRHAEVEFTDNLMEDLARRDLTINAMAVVINSDGTAGPHLHDPHDGCRHLEDLIIRFVGDSNDRVKEDALRMIRACRFTALGESWTIHDRDLKAIKEHAYEIKTVSKERIRDEILKALSYDKPSNFFRALDACGLLDIIFPDLARGIGCEQNEYHSTAKYRCKSCSTELSHLELMKLRAKNTSHC